MHIFRGLIDSVYFWFNLECSKPAQLNHAPYSKRLYNSASSPIESTAKWCRRVCCHVLYGLQPSAAAAQDLLLGKDVDSSIADHDTWILKCCCGALFRFEEDESKSLNTVNAQPGQGHSATVI